MVPKLLVVAALIATHDSVLKPPEFYTVHGPDCKIKVWVPPTEFEGVQLYVSENGGKKWALVDEMTRAVTRVRTAAARRGRPSKRSRRTRASSHSFRAKGLGEYWFAFRLKKTDGTFEPDDPDDLAPWRRVLVETGDELRPLASPAARELDAELSRLEMELIRLEAELIRKELKRLTEQKELTPAVEERIDQLRTRLKEARQRLRAAEADGPESVTWPPPNGTIIIKPGSKFGRSPFLEPALRSPSRFRRFPKSKSTLCRLSIQSCHCRRFLRFRQSCPKLRCRTLRRHGSDVATKAPLQPGGARGSRQDFQVPVVIGRRTVV